jgi:hypothetical protein
VAQAAAAGSKLERRGHPQTAQQSIKAPAQLPAVGTKSMMTSVHAAEQLRHGLLGASDVGKVMENDVADLAAQVVDPRTGLTSKIAIVDKQFAFNPVRCDC